MKYYTSLILNLCVFLCLTTSQAAYAPTIHAFHVSKCLIDYSSEDAALQISMHLFIDDLELALEAQGAKQLFVGTEREAEKTNTYIERYLNQRFQLSVNQTAVTFNYIGKETSEDLSAIWCYLEIPNIQQLSELEVHNTILMEIYDDQKNIISITGPNQKEGYFLFVQGQTHDKVVF